VLRSLRRIAGTIFGSGAAAGALVMTLLFALELSAAAGMQMMGVHDAALQHTIISRYGPGVLRQQAAILAFYLGLGALYGGLVAFSLRAWERARGRTRTRFRRWLLAALGTLLIQGWRLALAVIHYPQLFNDILYRHGGARAAIQVALTEHVPRLALDLAGWGALAILVLGPAATARGRKWLAGAISLRRVAMVATPVIAIAAILAIRARPSPAPVAADAPPNVLLIAVDSLRADRVGPGHEAVAPHLAALAQKSVRFEHAQITVPRTFPSWVTLLSGRWPHHHGIRHMFPDADERRRTWPLLPVKMKERGLRTVVVSDYSGEIFSRLDAGFEVADVPFFNAVTIAHQAGLNLHPALVPYSASRPGNALADSLASAPDNADPDRLADRAIEAIRAAAHQGPFFLTTFFSTPHFPYAAPDPWYRKFTDPSYRGPFRYEKPVAVLGNSDADLTAADVSQVRALYDGAVASVDAAIGRILDELERNGLASRTIVVLLADHGEGLYEEGRGMGHGEHLLGDYVTHIPLLVFDPVHKFPAHAVPGVVRDVDLAPTLAALTGAKIERADGVDLHALLAGEKSTLDLAAFSETGLWFVDNGPGFHPDERLPYPALPASVTVAPDDDVVLAPSLKEIVVVAKHRALRDDHWKLLYSPTRHGADWALYHLDDDFEERKNVATQYPNVFTPLREKLLGWMTEDGSAVENGFVVPR
jgi:arylsulfatase A-like enzyme